ncbi:uncharacterized protein LOC106804161 [Setaria italica]|uniref:uncharacterized protein LOC106804161 n=1 Tax=Setaria italica TaxID=4555 RepID=UPI000719A022|nr:uncharacterized protein LOC106804161 [Setaria italica]
MLYLDYLLRDTLPDETIEARYLTRCAKAFVVIGEELYKRSPSVWDLDLVGPFKRVPRGYTHLLVAVDKFTKWIEAKPITKVMSVEAVEFFLDIVYHIQFMGRKFLRFYDDYHIRVDWASVAHPRTNGQVERANGMVLHGLKPRIFDKLKKFTGQWAEEVPAMLWSLRMTPNRSTGFTPFFMVYGTEVVLPTDLDYEMPQVKAYDEFHTQF